MSVAMYPFASHTGVKHFISFEGELTETFCESYLLSLKKILAKSGGYIVDCSRVTSCDLAGFQLLLIFLCEIQKSHRTILLETCSPAIQLQAEKFNLDLKLLFSQKSPQS